MPSKPFRSNLGVWEGKQIKDVGEERIRVATHSLDSDRGVSLVEHSNQERLALKQPSQERPDRDPKQYPRSPWSRKKTQCQLSALAKETWERGRRTRGTDGNNNQWSGRMTLLEGVAFTYERIDVGRDDRDLVLRRRGLLVLLTGWKARWNQEGRGASVNITHLGIATLPKAKKWL